MAEFIVNEDYTLQIIPNSGGIPNTSPTKIELKVPKYLLSNKQALATILTIIQAGGCTQTGFTHTIGTGTISADSQKNLCAYQVPLRQNNEGMCNGSFTNNNSGTPSPCACKIKLVSAGQTKTMGE